MNVKELKNEFFKRSEEFSFTPIMDRKNHEVFVKYRELTNGKPCQNDLREISTLLDSNKEDQWFVFHLLNIIDELPETLLLPLINSILGYTGHYNVLASVVNNLRRLFGFAKLEATLHQLFRQSKFPIQKYFITLIVFENTIEDFYDYDNNKFTLYRICEYEWKLEAYKKIWRSVDKQKDKAYEESLKNLLQQRYLLMMNTFLSDEEPIELVRTVRYKFPHEEEAYALELLSIYHKALEKSKKIFPGEVR